MKPRSVITSLLIVIITLLAMAPLLSAQAKRATVNLPYRFPQPDSNGNIWMLFHGGRLMQQGPAPVLSEFATITINGQGFNTPAQNVTIEGSEALLENLRSSNFTLTRRIMQMDEGVLRIVDVIRNTRAQEAVASVTLNFAYNFGVQASRQLADPRKKDRSIAGVITDGQGRASLSVFGGAGSKVALNMSATPNNNVVQAIVEVKVPGNQEVALVTFTNPE